MQERNQTLIQLADLGHEDTILTYPTLLDPDFQLSSSQLTSVPDYNYNIYTPFYYQQKYYRIYYKTETILSHNKQILEGAVIGNTAQKTNTAPSNNEQGITLPPPSTPNHTLTLVSDEINNTPAEEEKATISSPKEPPLSGADTANNDPNTEEAPSSPTKLSLVKPNTDNTTLHTKEAKEAEEAEEAEETLSSSTKTQIQSTQGDPHTEEIEEASRLPKKSSPKKKSPASNNSPVLLSACPSTTTFKPVTGGKSKEGSEKDLPKKATDSHHVTPAKHK